MKFSYQVSQRKLIYVFGISYETHRGLLKIGETTLSGNDLQSSAKKRIDQYTKAANIEYRVLHTELAVDDKGNAFSDHDVHKILKQYKAELKVTNAQEWFCTDLDTVKRAIAAVKHGKKFIATGKRRAEIILRSEQEDAVSKTVEYFSHGKEFLWNAKMRFGKTLCALEVVHRMNFAKTIIVTHRPVVNDNWFTEYQNIFGDNENFDYGSRDNGSTFKELIAGKKNFIYFASMQDLRGSDTVGGKFDKNSKLFKTKWDCVIVDEAHEGTKTALGDNVIKALVKDDTKFLALSGTPFNILDNFDDNNVFTWDYIAEQRAKADWDKNSPETNPYAELPQLNIYTYNLGDMLQKIYLDDESEIAFSFREFFKTDNERFVHEDDVKHFLDLLVKPDENNYPFSRKEWREMFKHTFWIIPGVEAGRALSRLLQSHKVFRHFEIVNVAGDGDPDDKNGNALKAVQYAIKNYEYTITISCGKLTAGVTVPANSRTPASRASRRMQSKAVSPGSRWPPMPSHLSQLGSSGRLLR